MLLMMVVVVVVKKLLNKPEAAATTAFKAKLWLVVQANELALQHADGISEQFTESSLC